MKISEQFILDLISNSVSTRKDLDKQKRQFCKIHKIEMFSSDVLIEAYHKLIDKKIIKQSKELEDLLTLKNTRSNSGIVVISVLTKPYDCPGNCLYCPTEKNVPKSYFSNEPAVMRAIMCKYDPYLQTQSRLAALKAVGHPISKINIRVIGGTWSYYPRSYQNWFIRRVFQACNKFSNDIPADSSVIPAQAGIQASKTKQLPGSLGTSFENTIGPKDDKENTLVNLQRVNETAKHRIVEISIETRQDYVNEEEIKYLRKLGVTKVELGVQSIYDKVLRFNNRGNTDFDTIKATKMLKDAGFKVAYQMMLNLPSSDFQKDAEMFKELFHNSSYQPDHLKIYPMALVKESGVFPLYQQGKYKPFNKEELIDLISKIKSIIPYYCRIERVIRDIPSSSIVEGGAKASSLRQEVVLYMYKKGEECKCIRCREIKSNFTRSMKWQIFRQDYDASGGKEIFLSVESTDRKFLLSFLRLRIPSQYFTKEKHFMPVLDKSGIIREIHTYGPSLEIGERSVNAAQHQGFGKMLVAEAERVAHNEYGLSRLAIISGVGVRGFFEKLGYDLKKSYMVKELP